MSNKLQKIFAAGFALFGLFFAAIPFHISPVCTQRMPNGMPMPCYYTGRAEVILGFILFALGILAFFIGKKIVQIILSALMIVVGFFGIAFPLFITGGCKNPLMACHVHSFPLIYLSSGFIICMAACYLYLLIKKANR